MMKGQDEILSKFELSMENKRLNLTSLKVETVSSDK